LIVLASILNWILLQVIGTLVFHGRHQLRPLAIPYLQTEETRLLHGAEEGASERSSEGYHARTDAE